jgi:hypothetical protein
VLADLIRVGASDVGHSDWLFPFPLQMGDEFPVLFPPREIGG